MIAVQSSGCAPVARAFEEGKSVSEMWPNAATFAAGLRVPKPYGDTIILDICRSSGGVCLAIPDDTIFQSLLDWSRNEGILLSPEGAAATAAYDHLLATGYLKPSDRCVLFNTGAGLKYADVIADKLNLTGKA
jgi:threonine synthase